MDRGTQNRDLNDQNGSTVEAKRPPKGPVAIATSMTEDFVKTLLQTPEIAKGRRPG
ncbi:MAG: hypothetical protein JST16_01930, partial [Bdellovibrionales bacterium]|nr:hypothetical protein [Bdellovibrionales bacterium]